MFPIKVSWNPGAHKLNVNEFVVTVWSFSLKTCSSYKIYIYLLQLVTSVLWRPHFVRKMGVCSWDAILPFPYTMAVDRSSRGLFSFSLGWGREDNDMASSPINPIFKKWETCVFGQAARRYSNRDLAPAQGVRITGSSTNVLTFNQSISLFAPFF